MKEKNRFIKIYNLEDENSSYINISTIQSIHVIPRSLYAIKIRVNDGAYVFGEYQDFCRANDVMEKLIRAINNEEECFKYPIK